MPPNFRLKRYLNNNNVYGKVLYFNRLVTNLLHLQLCGRREGHRRIGGGV